MKVNTCFTLDDDIVEQLREKSNRLTMKQSSIVNSILRVVLPMLEYDFIGFIARISRPINRKEY